jgi:GWxTD domain-containing protein
MKKITILFLTLLIAFCISTKAQVLRDVNYSFQYDPLSALTFEIKPVRQPQGWVVFYKLHISDTTYTTDDFSIQWETRKDLSDKEGILLATDATGLIAFDAAKQTMTGKVSQPLSATPQVLLAKVLNNKKKQMWLFYRILDPAYTANGYLQTDNGEVVYEPYIQTHKPVSVNGYADGQSLIVSYYNDYFPTAAPAFSEGQARVNAIIKPDSIFTITNAQTVSFTQVGLYLVQKDTTTIEGVSFRVEEGYPKFKRLQDLVGPFVYVCSKEEFNKMRLSGEDKKQFDKGVLAITRDTDRARNFMKNYFRRAEAANRFFTSYKEGWKTDRGMIYLIYGEPGAVFKFADREVWTYGKTTFNFVKSSTLFDPDNYVLIRNKKFADEWYEKVDLIRNSRF